MDRRAIQNYGIAGVVLMENAGRGCVDVLCDIGVEGTVVICCGRGNNAGDGFVMARHLELRGHTVRVLLCEDPDKLVGDADTNYRILKKTNVPIEMLANDADNLGTVLGDADWIVDGLLGTGARGEPRPPMNKIIAQLNQHEAKKMAIDVPSGLDCDSGEISSTTFRADHTCTFVAAKPGLVHGEARSLVGELHVLDIGAPRCLIDEVLSNR
ncbi:MAG: NAD(P)H-hydrate epimerase [Planctomycetes bacterium]|nr:NAD(P)H-hydrate epimerase [Planctomycetota bacterium]